MNKFQRLTPKDGTLFAIYLADGEVLGKTRLNKLVARLQRDGFPISNQFTNAHMGPYDPTIDSCTTQLNDEGLIHKTVSPCICYENDRQDYHLTSSGKAYVESEIVPLIEHNQFYEFLMNSYMRIKDNYRTWTIPVLVNTTHDELYISPDNSKFLIEVCNTKDSLTNEFEDIERNDKGFCYVGLMLLGSLEFSIRCLERIQESHLDDQATGKNNILVNSKSLLEKVIAFRSHFNQKLESCVESLECRDSFDCLAKELGNIKYSLHCIELNAGCYKILEPFGEEWELTDYMTDEEESLFVSRLQTMNMTV